MSTVADADGGSREQKRRRRAVPPASNSGFPSGCLWTIAVYTATCVVLYGWVGWFGWLALAAPGLLVTAVAGVRVLQGIGLLLVANHRMARRGQRCVLVYSRSPVWESHILSRWVPRIGERAALLNWSDRANWGWSLEALLFNRFCRSSANFNPALIVLRGLHTPLVFRFFYAFHEAKHGRPEYLELLEDQMFGALGLDSSDQPRQQRRPETGAADHA